MKNKIGKLKGMTIVGLMALTLSTSAFAAETDPYANNKELQDIFKVYEEAPDNGMLLAPNPYADELEAETDPYADDKELQDIFELYDEAPDNGMLLAPNPNVVDKEIEDNNTSVLDSIGTFFNGIFNWFMGILG
ncbi:hypothetical protein [Vallitalea guaymasensis]|uniref:hypothetical protein n=1 Tax=Vallitalea guaymasensis TaxID=1185412 RepID=UPI0027299C44|nr:hypothetical protein [Vallitalea guaymasensis]